MRILAPKPPESGWTYASHPFWAKLFNFPTVAGVVVFAVGGRYFIRAPYGDLKIAAWIVIGLALCAVVFRGVRIGVWASPDRVAVQNFWRTHEFAWTDVVRIRSEWSAASEARYWYFELRDGREIRASGCPWLNAGSITQQLAATSRHDPRVEIVVDGKQPGYS